MKTYQTFARELDRLLGGAQAVRITVPEWMPLTVEVFGRSAEGGALVALAHTTVQHGDLMRDPELVFEIREHPAPADTPPGRRRIPREAWNTMHRDFRGVTNDVPTRLALDPATGATVLESICIVDRTAEPLSFRNDFTRTHQEVYRYSPEGRRTHLVPSLKSELRRFARLWFRNLHAQGFFNSEAEREGLG